VKFIIMQFSPWSVFLPFRSKYPPQHSVLKNPQSMFRIYCTVPNTLERLWKESLVACSRYYTGSLSERLRKIKKILNENRHPIDIQSEYIFHVNLKYYFKLLRAVIAQSV
jgi:hypothetical protein